MTEAEIAYCAGLFEGEGWIGTRTNHIKRVRYDLAHANSENRTIDTFTNCRLAISMKDIEPIELIWEISGVGRITSNRNRKNIMHTFYINKYKDIKWFTDQIYGWLSPRRKKQIEEAFEKYENRPLKRKLERYDIPAIRERINNGDTQTAIAKDYGVTRGAISHIADGSTWSHI